MVIAVHSDLQRGRRMITEPSDIVEIRDKIETPHVMTGFDDLGFAYGYIQCCRSISSRQP